MFQKFISVAAAATMAGALALAGATAAQAAPYVETNGPITGAATQPQSVKIVMHAPGAAPVSIVCTNATLALDIYGPTLSTATFASVVPTFNNCNAGMYRVTCAPSSIVATGLTGGLSGVTGAQIQNVNCTIVLAPPCSAVLTGTIDVQYSNAAGVLLFGGPQNLMTTASCPINVLRSSTVVIGGVTPAADPPALPHNFSVTSSPVPNVNVVSL